MADSVHGYSIYVPSSPNNSNSVKYVRFKLN
jgi:hypothetical protein